MTKDFEDDIETDSAPLDTEDAPTLKVSHDDAETETAYFERVRHRAYQLWQSDGEPDGRDQDYWFQAEREIAEEEGERARKEPRLVP